MLTIRVFLKHQREFLCVKDSINNRRFCQKHHSGLRSICPILTYFLIPGNISLKDNLYGTWIILASLHCSVSEVHHIFREICFISSSRVTTPDFKWICLTNLRRSEDPAVIQRSTK